MSRRSSEWQPQEEEEEVTKKDGDVRVENEPVRL
jgi:hypothetical protein